MKEEDRQQVHDVNDEELRRLTHDHLKVFAKFTSESCEICELLAPPFAKFAGRENFKSILFLRLNSDENPVAKKMMQEKVAPFFVSYCQGRILECDTLTEEQHVSDMLQRLRELEPMAL
ncbi:thioredoxin family protein [Hymenobacter volaticus]|uniref:Thioredoxin family protein n=1 Tax=Hymenobacter volaticus TaxID=2932254 RepID=A0ABY4GCE4_9BACT|nr:thioredoxin family protein [Hymenobacter volaticus]UOQ68079.1 thioredoxin family protein [Hymenobacter volaticus]